MSQFNCKVTSEQDMLLLGNMYVVSRALHVIAEQKIADLFESDRPKSVEELIKQCPMSSIALKKLLRTLCPFGIFKENNDGTFSLEKVGQTLKSDHPSCMRDLLFCESCRWNSFGQMAQSMQTGKTGFFELYKEEYFEHIAKFPHLQAGFDSHMKAISAKEDPIIAEYLPLENKKKIIDIGGGKGGLIKAILEKYPDIIGGVFELPGVAEQDLESLSRQYRQRWEIFSGSFFNAFPFKSDALLLKRVLHDWDDASCVQILSHCREALEDSSSEVYVVESVLEGKEDPPLLRIFDLLLLTVFGGVERNVEEYASLFKKAGLRLKNTIFTHAGMSIMVGQKI
ncbi:MAG: hypothetical protein COT84_02715 [Chlamydiae bacterium CG10_big_fil_rev_8_21_14_0_10_35_9]|nr:MAG: hypothetical protein COT84_02715 [Chlamydiae bacterium CG10_big_fil_rev_8_21_14_0_10_35_9]